MGANLVAQDDLKGIKRLMKKFIVLIFIFLSLAIGIILFFKGSIIETIFSLAPGTRKCPELVIFCFYALLTWQPLEFLYKLLEGICLSGGDTKFISRTYMTIFILFDFLAILILKHFGLLTSIKPIIYIFLIEPVPFIVIFYLRYKSLRWYNKII